MNDSTVSRRAVLLMAAGLGVAGLGAGLAGCDSVAPEAAPPADPPIEPLTPLLIGQQALVARYATTLSAFPELAEQLGALAAQTTAHTDALGDAVPAAAAQASTAAAGPGTASGAPPPSTSSRPVPAPAPAPDPAAALVELGQAVDAAAGALRSAALRAEGDLAALLGSCAASTACHAVVLG